MPAGFSGALMSEKGSSPESFFAGAGRVGDALLLPSLGRGGLAGLADGAEVEKRGSSEIDGMETVVLDGWEV